MLVEIDGNKELARDTKSLAILNKDNGARKRVKASRTYLKSLETKISLLEQRINTLEELMRNRTP